MDDSETPEADSTISLLSDSEEDTPANSPVINSPKPPPQIVRNPFGKSKPPAKPPVEVRLPPAVPKSTQTPPPVPKHLNDSPIIINSSPEMINSSPVKKTRKQQNESTKRGMDSGATTSTGSKGRGLSRGTKIADLDLQDHKDEEKQEKPKSKKTVRQTPKVVLVPAGSENEDDDVDGGRDTLRKKNKNVPLKSRSKRSTYTEEENKAIFKALCTYDCIETAWQKSKWEGFAQEIPELRGRTGTALEKHYRDTLRSNYKKYVKDVEFLGRFKAVEAMRKKREGAGEKEEDDGDDSQ